MNLNYVPAEGCIPTYTRTGFADSLHETFGFKTNYEIVGKRQMKKIFKDRKKQNIIHFLKNKKTLGFSICKGSRVFLSCKC